MQQLGFYNHEIILNSAYSCTHTVCGVVVWFMVHVCMHVLGLRLKKCMGPGPEFSPFEFFHDQFSHNPHYDLHSTADEPLAETPPEEAAETPSAPLVKEEGKLGEGTTHFYSI